MRNFLSQWFKRSADNRSAADERTLVPQQTLQTRTPRQRKLDASIASLKLLAPSMVNRLKTSGVQTVNDLLQLDLQKWVAAQGLNHRHIGRLKRVRHAVRMALTLRGMNPREAYLLIAIHRRSPEDIAADSPRHLYRDLERFVLSSRGKQLMQRIDFPTFQSVQAWVSVARQHQFAVIATAPNRSPLCRG